MVKSRFALSYFFILVALEVIVTSCAAAPDGKCAKISRDCRKNSDCCGECCSYGKCVESTVECQKQDPCLTYSCPPNKECYLQHVQCIQAPCPPIPACRPIGSTDYD